MDSEADSARWLRALGHLVLKLSNTNKAPVSLKIHDICEIALRASDGGTQTLTELHDIVCAMWHTKEGKKHVPSRNTVSSSLLKLDRIEKIGHVTEPIYKLREDLVGNDAISGEWPKPGGLAEWSAHHYAGALSRLDMPKLPERLATEIKMRLARVDPGGTSAQNMLEELRCIHDLVIKDQDDWLAFEGANSDELQIWVEKVKKTIEGLGFGGLCRESRVYDLCHVNDDETLKRWDMSHFYKYFFVQELHRPAGEIISYCEGDGKGLSDRGHNDDPFGGLPPMWTRSHISRAFGVMLDIGRRAQFYAQKYDDFTRRKTDGSLVVSVNPTFISETFKKENGRMARLVCHTKIIMTPEQYLYHQECKKKRKSSPACPIVKSCQFVATPLAGDFQASYDSHVSGYDGGAVNNNFIGNVITPFRHMFLAHGFREASGEEIDAFIRQHPEFDSNASYTVRDVMASPCLVRRAGPKMNDRTPYDTSGSIYRCDCIKLFLRFGAVWESFREIRSRVERINELGETHIMNIVGYMDTIRQSDGKYVRLLVIFR